MPKEVNINFGKVRNARKAAEGTRKERGRRSWTTAACEYMYKWNTYQRWDKKYETSVV